MTGLSVPRTCSRSTGSRNTAPPQFFVGDLDRLAAGIDLASPGFGHAGQSDEKGRPEIDYNTKGQFREHPSLSRTYVAHSKTVQYLDQIRL
jgi:hypothetical protein